eukprot:jgi/Picre1/28640/NNA_004040.t1
MKQYEGPSTAFDILVRRFPEASGMVIYDNACNLSRCALKREPGHFAKAQFRIDRVHQPGHVMCHVGYNLTSYPERLSCSRYIIESTRHGLAGLRGRHIHTWRPSAPRPTFMSQDHFLQYVRYFLYRQNMVKIQKIQEE